MTPENDYQTITQLLGVAVTNIPGLVIGGTVVYKLMTRSIRGKFKSLPCVDLATELKSVENKYATTQTVSDIKDWVESLDTKLDKLMFHIMGEKANEPIEEAKRVRTRHSRSDSIHLQPGARSDDGGGAKDS